jgi:hypothetical protein
LDFGRILGTLPIDFAHRRYPVAPVTLRLCQGIMSNWTGFITGIG